MTLKRWCFVSSKDLISWVRTRSCDRSEREGFDGSLDRASVSDGGRWLNNVYFTDHGVE